jgi:phosphohistidine phosphatase SixA
MEFYLLRAGRCGDETAGAGAGLSLIARQQTRAIGRKVMAAFEPSFAHVVSSAEPACVQSAELFADRIEYLGVIDVWRELGAGLPAAVLAKRLMTLASAAATAGMLSQNILVIGDEPWLSALGAALVSRPTFPQLMHAQVSCIENGMPRWFFRVESETYAPLLVAEA